MKPNLTARRAVLAAALAVAVLGAGLGAGALAVRLHPRPPVARAAAGPGLRASAPPATASPLPAGPSPSAGPWWTPLPAATGSFVPASLVIQRLRVTAPIEVRGVDAHNVMQAPATATDAVWYRFTARPGSGSNAVFAGHRDFGRLGNPAIFWHLDQLAAGDLVEIVSPQQTEIRYRVTQTRDFPVNGIPMATVLATDRVDEVTLITCAGTYAKATGYDHRIVVRAVRVA